MQLTELRTRLRRNVGNPTTGDVPNSTLDEHINTAYDEISTKFRFHQNRKRVEFNLVADSATYELPEEAVSLLRVRDTTNERKIEKADDAEVSRMSDQTTTGKPLKYTRYEHYIRFFPTPDDDYLVEIYYKRKVTDLSADADEPALPDTWMTGLLKLARYHYYDDEGDVEKANESWRSWERWVRDKPMELDEEKADFDSGVSFPVLEGDLGPRLDFNHSD